MEKNWEIEAHKKFANVRPFTSRINGEMLNEILSSYFGADHGLFVAKFLDLLIEEIRPSSSKDLSIELNPPDPCQKIKLTVNGVEIGSIFGDAR